MIKLEQVKGKQKDNLMPGPSVLVTIPVKVELSGSLSIKRADGTIDS
jgi:hypothetical protein